MARISKSVREDAIEALLASADGLSRGDHVYIGDYADGHGPGGRRNPATGLAIAAYRAAERALGFRASDCCAEAAALLLDGWNPGDPVVLRTVQS